MNRLQPKADIHDIAYVCLILAKQPIFMIQILISDEILALTTQHFLILDNWVG